MRSFHGFGLFIVATVTVLACSSESEPAAGPCAQRGGSFIAKYQQRDGTCGATAESVQNIEKQPTTVDAPAAQSIACSCSCDCC